jgi:hypothetical protein
VRAVDDDLDAARPRQPHDVADGEDLAGQVRDVTEMEHACARTDRALEHVDQVLRVRRRHGERDLPDDDAFAARALIPRGQHAAVVLVRRQHLVAGLHLDAELADLERFRRVARDRHLLGIAAERARELPAHALDLRLEHLPHRVHRRFVGERR